MGLGLLTGFGVPEGVWSPPGRAVFGNGAAGAARGMEESGAKVALPALSKWIPKEPLIMKARRDNRHHPERSRKPARGERSSHGIRGAHWIPSLPTAPSPNLAPALACSPLG